MKDTPYPTKTFQIRRDVLSYLIDYPEAQDTLEGIVQWWLLDRKIRRLTSTVKRALADLATEGWILTWQGVDARTHYKINQSKFSEIQALLQDMQSE